MGVRKLPSAPLPLPLLSQSPTVCFCIWEVVRIFHVAYMTRFLEEARQWRRSRRRSDCSVSFGHWFNSLDRCIVFYIREEITGRTLKSKRKSELGAVAG